MTLGSGGMIDETGALLLYDPWVLVQTQMPGVFLYFSTLVYCTRRLFYVTNFALFVFLVQLMKSISAKKVFSINIRT